MAHRILQVTTGILLGLAFVAVLLSRGVIGPAAGPGSSMLALESAPYPAPSLALTAAGGEPFDLRDLRGEVTLVFFGFANCPDVCPLTLFRWTQALEELEGMGSTFRGVFVTVDPGRDTPEALREWMQAFHPSFVALTGTEDEVADATTEWGVEVFFQTDLDAIPEGHEGHVHAGAESDPEQYFVTHSTRTFVVDRDGRVVGTVLPHIDDAALMETLRPLLRL